jgi:hypothetical protein
MRASDRRILDPDAARFMDFHPFAAKEVAMPLLIEARTPQLCRSQAQGTRIARPEVFSNDICPEASERRCHCRRTICNPEAVQVDEKGVRALADPVHMSEMGDFADMWRCVTLTLHLYYPSQPTDCRRLLYARGGVVRSVLV